MEFNEAKLKIIQALSDGKFHSGSELANRLGVGRTAVWKHIKGVATLDLEIDAISGRGYRLTRPLELLDPLAIKSSLTARALKRFKQVIIHQQIDSTNQYLVDAAGRGEANGTVCVAEMQTAGKGRSGNRWISPFGHNIYLSLLWWFNGGPDAISGLSLAVGIAVMRMLEKSAIDGVKLKWPNDILWENRKLGGILIDVVGEANGPCAAVIGIGLNRYMSKLSGKSISQDWVDLEAILGQRQFSRNAQVALLLNELLPIVSNYEKTGIRPFLPEWRNWDAVKGKQVTFDAGGSQIRGTVIGITDQGLLIIQDNKGRRSTFAAGEVTLLQNRCS